MSNEEAHNIYNMVGSRTGCCQITELVEKYEHLQQENKELKENRDKTIEFIDKYNTYFNDDISKKPNFVPYIPKEVREILKGDK